jgi:hypothetical protein
MRVKWLHMRKKHTTGHATSAPQSLRPVCWVGSSKGNTCRMAYVAVFPEVVYVLDVFEKKARKGKTTPTPDNQRVRAAFRTARSHYMSIFGGRA